MKIIDPPNRTTLQCVLKNQAFTLIELLAVTAVMIVLAGVFVPALANSRASSDLTVCQDHLRRIGHAFSLYSADNREELCPTGGLDVLVSSASPTKSYPALLQQWCMGDMGAAPGWTNSTLIRDSLLFPYVNSLAAYHCPSDPSSISRGSLRTVPSNGNPRIRSLAANCFINPINPWSEGRSYRKQGDLILGPANTWVAIEENPASINDGWLVHPPLGSTSAFWVDYPASFHREAGSLVFDDDHVETRHWTDRSMIDYGGAGQGPPTPKSDDHRWLSERTTVLH